MSKHLANVGKLLFFRSMSVDARDSMSKTQCQRLNVRDSMSETQCQRLNVRDSMSETQCQRLNVRDSMSEAHCQRLNVRGSLSETQCQRQNVRDKMSETKCLRPNVRDSMSETQCQTLNVRHSMSESDLLTWSPVFATPRALVHILIVVYEVIVDVSCLLFHPWTSARPSVDADDYSQHLCPGSSSLAHSHRFLWSSSKRH